MKISMMGKGPRMMAAGAMILGMTTSVAAVQAFVSGGVTITGTRYVDGVPEAVRCTSGEGNTVTIQGGTAFEIVSGPSCFIYSDTDDTDALVFKGEDSWIVKSGVTTSSALFSGVQTAAGPSGSDPAHGTMTGTSKYATSLYLAGRGTISYSRKNSANQIIIFVGKYKTVGPFFQF